MSKRKRKNKVVKLSEKDYGNYIMSLKGDEPRKVVPPEKGKFDDTGA